MRKEEYVTDSEVQFGTTKKELIACLQRIGVEPGTVLITGDIASGAALVRFTWKGNAYERRSIKQPNVSKNMRVIFLNLRQKAIDHRRGVENFGDSMYRYLQIGAGPQGAGQAPPPPPPQDEEELRKAYAALGLTAMAANAEIEKRYKGLVQRWHPDRQTIDDAALKEEATQRMQGINAAYTLIKKARGMA